MHMTVPQLRRLLRLLQPHHPDDSPAHRPAHTRRLLRCLSRMVGEERATGPSHYLWMDGGTHSGLRLRPLAGFSKRHYSFITWLRLDAEGGAEGGFSPSSSSSYRPYLFSLVAEDGTALEAYFIPSSSTTDAGGGGRCFSLQLEVRRDKVISHVLDHRQEGEECRGSDEPCAVSVTDNISYRTTGDASARGVAGCEVVSCGSPQGHERPMVSTCMRCGFT